MDIKVKNPVLRWCQNAKRNKWQYSKEFRAEAVKLVVECEMGSLTVDTLITSAIRTSGSEEGCFVTRFKSNAIVTPG